MGIPQLGSRPKFPQAFNDFSILQKREQICETSVHIYELLVNMSSLAVHRLPIVNQS